MARGIRNLTPEQERQLYEASKMRDRLSVKGLSRTWGIPVGSVKEIIRRQRRLEDEIGRFGRMETQGLAV